MEIPTSASPRAESSTRALNAGVLRQAPARRRKIAPSRRLSISDTPLALRSIIAYKTAKAWVQALLGLALLALLPFGLPGWLAAAGVGLRHHYVHAWSIRLADAIVRDTSRRHIQMTIGALFLDAALTAVEAHALKRGWWWGPWLVVVASGSLIPFEVLEWLRHPRPTRLLIIAANLAVVAYFVRHAWRAHAAVVSTADPTRASTHEPP